MPAYLHRFFLLTVPQLPYSMDRPAKPLAVMLPVADGLPDAARQLLTTPAAPIVLVDKKYVPELCDDIAPDLNEVGVMLPANPLQHLLLQELQSKRSS